MRPSRRRDPSAGAGSPRTRRRLDQSIRRLDRAVPDGWKTVVGIPMVIGGALGFLPVLGFWMLPMGLALIALDARKRRSRGSQEQERKTEPRAQSMHTSRSATRGKSGPRR